MSKWTPVDLLALADRLHLAALTDPHDEREVMHAGLMREARDAVLDFANIQEGK